jgi:hypothetical protein
MHDFSAIPGSEFIFLRAHTPGYWLLKLERKCHLLIPYIQSHRRQIACFKATGGPQSPYSAAQTLQRC